MIDQVEKTDLKLSKKQIASVINSHTQEEGGLHDYLRC